MRHERLDLTIIRGSRSDGTSAGIDIGLRAGCSVDGMDHNYRLHAAVVSVSCVVMKWFGVTASQWALWIMWQAQVRWTVTEEVEEGGGDEGNVFLGECYFCDACVCGGGLSICSSAFSSPSTYSSYFHLFPLPPSAPVDLP